jgi:hypothetical protein
MTWHLGPTPFISLNTQTEGVGVMHGRHRFTRYVMTKIHLESVSEVTVVYALLCFFLLVIVTQHHCCVTVTLNSYSECPRFKS